MDRVNGINNKQSKKVSQLSKEGREIAVFHSIRQAARSTGENVAHIGSCCAGRRKTTGGYRWRYA